MLMRDLINLLHDYSERVSSPPPEYLNRLERETHLKTLAPQMLSGPLQGRLDQELVLAIRRSSELGQPVDLPLSQ